MCACRASGIPVALLTLAARRILGSAERVAWLESFLPPDATTGQRQLFPRLSPLQDVSLGVAVAWDVLTICIAAFILFAGVQLIGAKSRTIPMVGAILAMLPCITPSCGCFVGLPIGIWVLYTLSRPEVIQFFRERTPA